MIWYEHNSNDIVISTRIRLARNLDRVPFPNALKDKKETTQKIKDAVFKSNSALAGLFTETDLDSLPKTEREALEEEHLISPQMINGTGQSVLISKDQTMSIMLMEEDHIRLQVILGGFALDEAWETANRVDDVMEESLGYAFDETFGYLTACPTNAGTGLRASVMMHLPALTMTKNMGRITTAANNLGLAVRGLYGEGSKSYGNLYQISNQVTMGVSEQEIIDKLKNIVNQIIDLEKQARETLSQNNKDTVADQLYRAYGILKYARAISSTEAKSLLSLVILGRNMGILPKEGKLTPVECMVLTEPACISKRAGRSLAPEERDKERATMIRENI